MKSGIQLLLAITCVQVALAKEEPLITPDHVALTYFSENWVTIAELKSKSKLSEDELEILEWKATGTLTYAYQMYILTKYGTRFEGGKEPRMKQAYLREIARVVGAFSNEEVRVALRLMTDSDHRSNSTYRWSVEGYTIERFDEDLPDFLRLTETSAEQGEQAVPPKSDGAGG